MDYLRFASKIQSSFVFVLIHRCTTAPRTSAEFTLLSTSLESRDTWRAWMLIRRLSKCRGHMPAAIASCWPLPVTQSLNLALHPRHFLFSSTISVSNAKSPFYYAVELGRDFTRRSLHRGWNFKRTSCPFFIPDVRSLPRTFRFLFIYYF